jgi:hypothetical protein
LIEFTFHVAIRTAPHRSVQAREPSVRYTGILVFLAGEAMTRTSQHLGRSVRLGLLVLSLFATWQAATREARAVTASQTFTNTGENAFVVPALVTSIHVQLVAGAGQSQPGGTPSGGAGALVNATIAVTPGQTLYAEVGGGPLQTTVKQGATGGGGAGGGDYGRGGGGASDVRTCPLSCGQTLASRLVVAGGGGGAGGAGTDSGAFAGAGGDAGTLNGIVGGTGGVDLAYDAPGTGGGGATPNAAGAAGMNSEYVDASKGQLATGGAGGGGIYVLPPGGGGGGGGIYGGGGGGAGTCSSTSGPCAGGAGGGGGSSGVPAGVTSVSGLAASLAPAIMQPSVTFTWALPAPTVTIGAASGVSTTAASLTGSVNPNGAPITDCHFELNPGALQIPCAQQVGGGSTPVAISATAAGLTPGTLYAATLVASSSQGTSTSAPVQFNTTATQFNKTATGGGSGSGLTISRLALSPTSFAAARKGPSLMFGPGPGGTTVTLVLSATSRVSFKVFFVGSGRRASHGRCSLTRRRGRGCTLLVPLSGGFAFVGHGGLNQVRFTGRLGRHALRPGRYVLKATAPGSQPVSLTFRIVR